MTYRPAAGPAVGRAARQRHPSTGRARHQPDRGHRRGRGLRRRQGKARGPPRNQRGTPMNDRPVIIVGVDDSPTEQVGPGWALTDAQRLGAAVEAVTLPRGRGKGRPRAGPSRPGLPRRRGRAAPRRPCPAGGQPGHGGRPGQRAHAVVGPCVRAGDGQAQHRRPASQRGELDSRACRSAGRVPRHHRAGLAVRATSTTRWRPVGSDHAVDARRAEQHRR